MIIFDIETCGLNPQKKEDIYVLSYIEIDDNYNIINKNSITKSQDIISFFNNRKTTFVGHNIIRFDLPVLEKILNIKVNNVIDTLGLSWHIYPNKDKHSLEYWGHYFKYPKVKIDDWKNLDIKEYIKRCETDVEINLKVFKHLHQIEKKLDSDTRIIGYLNFILTCLKEQEETGIDIDLQLIQKSLLKLNYIFEKKRISLSNNMPNNSGKIIKTRPVKLHKKDKTLSKRGEEWYKYLRDNNLSEDTEIIREKPNPGSPKQLKEWLFLLGWKPDFYKESKNTGEKLPQVSLPFGQGLTNSVKDLIVKYPILEDLNDYYKVRHRIGMFKSFLDTSINNKIKCTAHGLTNTLRLKHVKPIANMPKPKSFFGKEIRGSLIVPNNDFLMCGADLSALEDTTKQHFIYFYDKEYVEEMRVPGFDPHLDISLLTGIMTKEEINQYKIDGSFSEKRHMGKTINFTITYGSGINKIANSLKISYKQAKNIYDIYWERNKAVKQVERSLKIKTIDNQKWLYNPVSGFWYFLKAEKDKFSTLNQGTGSFVFNLWLRIIKDLLRSYNITVIFQYHDELAFIFKKELKENIDNILKSSIIRLNNILKLNVPINADWKYGMNYSQIH